MPSNMLKDIAWVAKPLKYDARITLQIFWVSTSSKPQDINIGIDYIVIKIRRNKLCVRKIPLFVYIFWGVNRVVIWPLWSAFFNNSFSKFPNVFWNIWILCFYILRAKLMFWKIPIDTFNADSFNIICIISMYYNPTLIFVVESLK